MDKYCILYNPLAGNNRGKAAADELVKKLAPAQTRLVSCLDIKDYAEFFTALPQDEKPVLVGGDGTLNCFINDSDGKRCGRSVWFSPSGSGNDFWKDIGKKPGDPPVLLDPYMESLPTVRVNGITRKFINGIGYGIDGYCCEEGDRQRQKNPVKQINYPSIAVKGLLGAYHPTDATVICDGVAHHYPKAWLAPTMIGRYFGGGIMATPDQDRFNKEHVVTNMVENNTGKLHTLIMFPSLFDGSHKKYTGCVHFHVGHEITVKFVRPTALQIDGETILNVTEYSVSYY